MLVVLARLHATVHEPLKSFGRTPLTTLRRSLAEFSARTVWRKRWTGWGPGQTQGNSQMVEDEDRGKLWIRAQFDVYGPDPKYLEPEAQPLEHFWLKKFTYQIKTWAIGTESTREISLLLTQAYLLR